MVGPISSHQAIQTPNLILDVSKRSLYASFIFLITMLPITSDKSLYERVVIKIVPFLLLCVGFKAKIIGVFESIVILLYIIGYTCLQIYRFKVSGNFSEYEYDSSQKGLASIIGHEQAKVKIRQFINSVENPHLARLWGCSTGVGGLLLYGPPGTGKTALARAAAFEFKYPFLETSPGQFLRIFVGSGSKNVDELFQKARSLWSKHGKPCIIFFDELDAIGRRTHESSVQGNSECNRTISALLTAMTDSQNKGKVYCIGATNSIDMIDDALKRDGRFGMYVECLPPVTQKERLDILKVHTQGTRLYDERVLGEIATQTNGFTGAELEGLVNETGSKCMMIALSGRKPNLIDTFNTVLEEKRRALVLSSLRFDPMGRK